MNEISNIKFKAFSSIIWKILERVAAQGVSLVVSITLARLLIPDDYSVVSIVSIFFVFCNLFISSGFNTALIQKKNADIDDYSSVLWLSLAISVIMYAIMFFSAPYIASLYQKEILVPVIRVMGITFFVSAYKGVLCAHISSALQFKSFFLATISGTVISAIVGILMALNGFGPWALVFQQMTNTVIDTVLLTITSKVKFRFRISFERLKELFRYGWKMFATSIIAVTYDEIKPLIIGIKFKSVDLAYYNKGRSFPQLINSTVTDSISAVLFPVISKVQDDENAVLNITRKYMRVSSYIIFPLLLGFFAVSENFIKIILTEKWIPILPYIKIFTFDYLLNIVQVGNQQSVKAIGRSDIILKLEIVKKTLYFIVVTLFIFFANSPYVIAASSIVCTIIATIVNVYPNVKLIGYAYKKQFMDLLPNMVLAMIMFIIVTFVGRLNISAMPLLFIQIVVGFISYLLLSIFTKNSNLKYILDLIKERKGE